MTYQVVAPLVLAKDQLGQVHHVYNGGLIPWLSDEQAEHFLGEKLVVKVGGNADKAEPEPPADGDKPAADAIKQQLIDWLVANAVDADGDDYTESALKPKNKDQLWELIDAVE